MNTAPAPWAAFNFGSISSALLPSQTSQKSLSKDESKKIGHLIKTVESEVANDGFKLNKDKIRVLRPHQAQRICGVTINSGKSTISRKQRRVLRAAKHRQVNGRETSFTAEQIAGWEAYISGVSS